MYSASIWRFQTHQNLNFRKFLKCQFQILWFSSYWGLASTFYEYVTIRKSDKKAFHVVLRVPPASVLSKKAFTFSENLHQRRWKRKWCPSQKILLVSYVVRHCAEKGSELLSAFSYYVHVVFSILWFVKCWFKHVGLILVKGYALLFPERPRQEPCCVNTRFS